MREAPLAQTGPQAAAILAVWQSVSASTKFRARGEALPEITEQHFGVIAEGELVRPFPLTQVERCCSCAEYVGWDRFPVTSSD